MIAAEAVSLQRSWLFRQLHHKWSFDEIYDATFVRGLLGLRTALNWFDAHVVDGLVNLSATLGRGIAWLDGLFDAWVVDGAVNGVATVITRAGATLRRIQTGRLQTYVVMVMAGILVLMVIRMI